jgi:hypothetical protein
MGDGHIPAAKEVAVKRHMNEGRELLGPHIQAAILKRALQTPREESENLR